VLANIDVGRINVLHNTVYKGLQSTEEIRFHTNNDVGRINVLIHLQRPAEYGGDKVPVHE